MTLNRDKSMIRASRIIWGFLLLFVHYDVLCEHQGLVDISGITMDAKLSGTELIFTIHNQRDNSFKVNSDFAFNQTMRLLVVMDEAFGKVLVDDLLGIGRPGLHLLTLNANNQVSDTVYLADHYPELKTKTGSALIFWSTDLFIADQKGNFGAKRMSGSLRISLPLGSSDKEHGPEIPEYYLIQYDLEKKIKSRGQTH